MKKPREPENLLVHGDNLAALAKLRPRFAGKIRCAYLDPPFNTGRTFAEYNDALGTRGMGQHDAAAARGARPAPRR